MVDLQLLLACLQAYCIANLVPRFSLIVIPIPLLKSKFNLKLVLIHNIGYLLLLSLV